jgi:GWxTD domain-containing protein
LEQLRVVASNQEWRRARSIKEVEEKRRFLAAFWKNRDPSPSTVRNEFKEAYQSRVQFANKQYGDGMLEGWKTDRGRVLLQYGEPSAVEANHHRTGELPHEIWQYDYIQGEGQGLFVFLDRDGFGSFRLIHSSVAGEPKSQNWQAELTR